jgi:hypothetical protein
MVQLVDLDAVEKPTSPDDTLSADAIAEIDAVAAHMAEYLDAMLSQIKRVIYGGAAGTWKGDFIDSHGDVSLLNMLTESNLLTSRTDGHVLVDRNSGNVIRRAL